MLNPSVSHSFSEAAAKRAKVLVVEDDDHQRVSIMGFLRGAGHEVFGARNCDGALKYLDKPIDVVLTDLHFDGKRVETTDGLDLIREWRVARAGTPFIVITGDREPNTTAQAFKLGAVDFISKPTSEEKIMEVVAEVVERLSI